jgi:hypothetical protein
VLPLPCSPSAALVAQSDPFSLQKVRGRRGKSLPGGREP